MNYDLYKAGMESVIELVKTNLEVMQMEFELTERENKILQRYVNTLIQLIHDEISIQSLKD